MPWLVNRHTPCNAHLGPTDKNHAIKGVVVA